MSAILGPPLDTFLHHPSPSWHRRLLDPLLQWESPAIHQHTISLDSQQYTFDQIHPQDHSNAQIYQTNLENLLEPYIQGTNVTVFIYGDTQQSSILDPKDDKDDQGIVHRFGQALFNRLEETLSSATVHVSYAKIDSSNHNNDTIDLLHPSAADITDDWVMDTDELMR
ncbi:hypothetical protein CLU79DRAFT_583186 [Phycomyces nitens]|nr:hypothetical protein CLU79DRAFT_583186 [Phycomyces nitens]